MEEKSIRSAKEYTALDKQQHEQILHRETARIKTQVERLRSEDISLLKHENWMYVGIAKGSYNNHDAKRLQSVLDENQLNYVYEYVGTQQLLEQSREVLSNTEMDSQAYAMLEKNIAHLESHLHELSQRADDYPELELNVGEGYRVKSVATSSHYVDLTPQGGNVSIKRKFGNHIDKMEYNPPLSGAVNGAVKGVSAVGITDDDEGASRGTLDTAIAIPSTVGEVSGSVKTAINKGVTSTLPKRIATSVGERALNTKSNLSTSTDTGIDGIKTAVTVAKTTADTKKTINSTVKATKGFAKSVKDTPKAVAKDVKKLKAVVTTVGKSKVGAVVVCVLVALMVVPILAESTVTTVFTGATSLFGWLQDSDDTSKDYLEVLYEDWECISNLLSDVQTLYDTTVTTPTAVNSNWKRSFERYDSESHLYGYQDATLGEKYAYREISLNVLSALAIDKYRELENGSNTVDLEFTEDEIEEKLKLFYETEYTLTTFYCSGSVLDISNAYDECKQYDYFSSVFNTPTEKARIYGDGYSYSGTNRIWMHIEGESNYRYINFKPVYYQIWATQDSFLIHELNGEEYLYANGTTAYVIGDASFDDGSHVYLVRLASLDGANYPSYADVKAIYSRDGLSYNYGGEIKVLDVKCKGHREVSCYISTKIKENVTATDLGLTDEEYQLFLAVKEELNRLIDEGAT